MQPWYLRYPRLFSREKEALSRAYPELLLCEQELDQGNVVFHGTLQGPTPEGLGQIVLWLRYPEEFPYFPPRVVPLLAEPAEPHADPMPGVRFFSSRHQMADGTLCLFEHDAAVDPRSVVGGELALLRTEQWLRATAAGRLPPGLDSADAELEAHYNRAGDVLLGPIMFEEGGRGGRLALVAQQTMWRKERYPLFAVTHLESEGQLKTDKAILEKLGIHYPDSFWQAMPETQDGVIVVPWYALDKEPQPVRTVGELAAILFPGDADAFDRLRRGVLQYVLSGHAVDVPLRYPRREGGFEWLFLRILLRANTLRGARLPGFGGARGLFLDIAGGDALKTSPLVHLRTHDLRPSRLLIRNRGRIPEEARALSLGVAGAGALGSTCIDLLTKAGIGSLRIFDPGILNAGNAIRHLANAAAAGAFKAGTTAAIANAHNPHCAISSEPKSVLDAPDDDPIWASKAILSAIADDGVELALNRHALSLGATVYFLRAFRGGSVGMLYRARPREDACFECLLLRWLEGDPGVPAIPAAEGETIGRECGQPILASSAADMAVVAGLGVRQVLADLSAAGKENLWIWATDGIKGHPDLGAPFSRSCRKVLPHPDCPACSRRAPAKMEIPRRIHAEMVRLARADAPNETGGILLGRKDGDVLRVEAASDAGPKASGSPSRFERDGEHCQRFMEETAARTGLAYVGEWHSHPSSGARPSPRDIASMLEIAADDAYASPSPSLVIVGLCDGKRDPELSATMFFRGIDSAAPISVSIVDEAAESVSSADTPQMVSTASFAAEPSALME